MRYILLICLSVKLLFSDSIIDFGKPVSSSNSQDYESRGDGFIEIKEVKKSNFTKKDSKKEPNKIETIEATESIPAIKTNAIKSDSKYNTKTQVSQDKFPIAPSPKPTNMGNDLKGKEFFDYYIKDKPKSIVRDFYIWQYLSENQLSAKEINTVYAMLNAKNPYLRKVLNNIGKKEKLPRDIECANMGIKHALKQDNSCLISSVRGKLSAFKTLPKNDTEAVTAKLSKTHKDTVEAIKILSSSDRTSKLFVNNPIAFAMVYNSLSYDEKHKIKTPTQDELKIISQYNTSGFYNILNAIVLDSKLNNLKNILTKLDITQAPHNTLFLLGINEVRFGSKDKAMTYFRRAQEKASASFFIDRAVFWQYLISTDKKYLEQLLKSKNVNLFSIYASQKLGKAPSYKIISSLPSIRSDNPPFDTKDPYVWYNISQTLLNTSDPVKLAKVIPYFSYKETMPQLAYLMQKIDKFSTNYYISPYENLINWESKEEQNFVFSIAKQESHFIPTLISRSFALGLMQIMPANVKPFAKEMGLKNINYNDLFDPKTALEMGRHFIKQLKREYKHPLFVSYAYNGGPGFLRRLLAKNELFLQNRQYEPWISMELIPYEESRIYGMRVLANFVIYQELSGKKVKLEDLLKETLIYKNDNITK